MFVSKANDKYKVDLTRITVFTLYYNMVTADEKYELITRRLQEVLGGETIKAILAEGRRSPRCYWGASCKVS